ncbi:MAG: TetR/AcrR family transcriptional regulator [Eubacteriales bacterium]|jgi:AcrR family transcriptional regulator
MFVIHQEEVKKVDSQPKDRRIRRTRKLLKQSLAEWMQEKDFQNITVKDIADRADLNRGTFYLHYTDPYDLLEKLENDTLEDFQAMIDAHRTQVRGGTLLPVLQPTIAYIQENSTICRCLFCNTASRSFLEKFQSLILRNGVAFLQERYPSVEHVDDPYLFSFISYGLVGLLQQWFQTHMALPQSDLVVLADDLITAAVVRAFGLPVEK